MLSRSPFFSSSRPGRRPTRPMWLPQTDHILPLMLDVHCGRPHSAPGAISSWWSIDRSSAGEACPTRLGNDLYGGLGAVPGLEEYTFAAAVLLIVSSIAAYRPVRRVVTMDSAIALREE